MELQLERKFQLEKAMREMASLDADQLRLALAHAWRCWLLERQINEELLRSSIGMEVSIGGPLLPPTLRQAAG